VIDPSGRETEFTYANGRPVSVTRSDTGQSVTETYAYDGAGNPVSATDAAGNVRTMAYDEFDRLVAATSSEGIVRELDYDSNDNVIVERLSAGTGATRTREIAYDGLDLPVTVTQSVSADISASVHTTYDAGGNVASVTLPSGIVKRYEYDASDRPTRISVQPAGSGGTIETRYEYDADGNMIRETDSMGHATVYAYDGYGRLAQVTDALGDTREYSYDRLGNVTHSVAKNASGATLEDARAEWNAVGNLLSSATMSGSLALVTSYTYNPAGLPLRKTDPMGRSTIYDYDGLGRLVRETDATGNSISTEYDARSLPVVRTLSGSGGKSVSEYMAYDRDGRPVKTWRELDGRELATRYEYDALGNVTRRTDPDGGETRYEYDLGGRLLSETRSGSGLSSMTSYTYDLSGNLLSVTDPAGNITRYEYDGSGRLAREIMPDGAATSYGYDALGRAVSVTDPNGTVTTNAYDALGRLSRRDIAAGSGVLGVSWETYSYDALGRLVGSSDSLGQDLSFAYDPAGRLASETADGLSTRYSYDAAGDLQSLSYPSGLSVSMERDGGGRTLSLSSPGREYARYAYSGAELSGIAYGNGARTELAYDPLSRLASLSHFSATGGIIAESYAYDSENKLLSDGWETYSYDGLDRLRRAVDTVEYDPAKRQTTSRGNQYSYDPAGNRTALDRFAAVSRIVNACKTVKVNGVNTRVCADETRESESSYVLESYADNALNQYSESVRHPDMANRDETAYAYDANGNMTSDGTYLYGYDYRNRLVRITRLSDARILKEIAYDVLGRKTGWKSNSTSVRLQYAGDRMIEEYSRLHSNPYALVGSYVWGERNSDDIVAMIR
jgi:YD repeat-containing protein